MRYSSPVQSLHGSVTTAILLAVLAASSSFAAQDQQLVLKLAALEKLPPTFSFAVLGDTRAGDPACETVYQKVLAAVLVRKPDLIVNTGDQIDKPGNVEHWKRFWELSKDVSVPHFFTVGNHDAHIDVAGSEETYKAQVELTGNELYYSFTAANALFVVLDSYRKGEDKRITGDQFTWVDGVLARSKEKHKFVFVHHPLYPELMKETWPVERFEYRYRSSLVKSQPGEVVILSILLRLAHSSPEVSLALANTLSKQRHRIKPPGATMGSMFKNPPGDYAGRLIDAAGLKGAAIGGAEISPLHANFFINRGNATAQNVYDLIQLTRNTVVDKFGVQLELEIELVGEWQ